VVDHVVGALGSEREIAGRGRRRGPALERLTRDSGKASILMVVTDGASPEREKEVGAALRTVLERAGFGVASTTTVPVTPSG
jgi:hypothetical protein